MTINMWIVIVICLVAGYLIVNKLYRGPLGAPISSGAPSTNDSPPLRWFEVLGVSEEASIDEIEASFRRKISLYHPDKVAHLGPEFTTVAEAKTKALNAAYSEGKRRR